MQTSEMADNETGFKSRTDANLTNLRTGTDQKGMATSTHWIGRLHRYLKFDTSKRDIKTSKTEARINLKKVKYNLSKLSH